MQAREKCAPAPPGRKACLSVDKTFRIDGRPVETDCEVYMSLLCEFQQRTLPDRTDYITGGKLSQWLAKNAEAAVLVELPRNPGGQEYVQDCAQKLIAGLDAWFAAQ